MRSHLRMHWPVILLLGFLTGFHLWGSRTIPFHPDESTQLYMSSDLEAFFTHPGSLVWDPARVDDPRQRYRELDAPITRYLLGLGRIIVGMRPLPSDWDWSKSWQENQLAGAIPEADLLATGRLTVTLLLPFSLVWIYRSGYSIGGRLTGLVATALLGMNSLVLLHARRAMAEGALTFAVTFFLFTVSTKETRPWLIALAAALAFNAKQSAIALFPVGIFAALWAIPGRPGEPTRRLPNLFQFLGTFLLVTLALNPLLWSNPIEAARASLEARGDLLRRQISDTERYTPEKVLGNPGQGTIVLLANLYITPPAFAEVGNYQAETAASEAAYLDILGHDLFRGIYWGGVILIWTVFGMILAAVRTLRGGFSQNKVITLYLLATLSVGLTLAVAVPLPWQRYAMPLVGLGCLWTAYGLTSLRQVLPARS